jgi:hypothetical protein
MGAGMHLRSPLPLVPKMSAEASLPLLTPERLQSEGERRVGMIQKALPTAQNYLPGGRDQREAISRRIRRLGRPNIELAGKAGALFRSDNRVTVRTYGLSDMAGDFDLFVTLSSDVCHPGLASVLNEDAARFAKMNSQHA